MNFFAVRQVREFVDSLEGPVQADVKRLMILLEKNGQLSMPYAKPIGQGLWELRRTGRPQIRILYGFCHGYVVLVYALQKQRRSLGEKEIQMAHGRLAAYCADIARML